MIFRLFVIQLTAFSINLCYASQDALASGLKIQASGLNLTEIGLNFTDINLDVTTLRQSSDASSVHKTRRDKRRETYICQMKAPPAALLFASGTRNGHNAGGLNGDTNNGDNVIKKFDAQAEPVQAYSDELRSKQEAMIASVIFDGDDDVQVTMKDIFKYSYTTTINGFAADFTTSEVEKLLDNPEITYCTPNTEEEMLTSNTPEFLDMEKVWNYTGGIENAGKDIIIAVIDSGIEPNHPSFYDDPKCHFKKPQRWKGECAFGDGFDPKKVCNNKLIGARYFNHDEPYNNAYDEDGHGSHTAATAGGNSNVTAMINGQDQGTISGMAPCSHLAIYKICGRFCKLANTIAAIEAAVVDGVDVINFSISGSVSQTTNPTYNAFLGAAAVDIFIAASGGNSGPGASTVNHNIPWVTTVAAGTHDRASTVATIVLNNGRNFTGASMVGKLDFSDLVYAGDVASANATIEDAKLCKAQSLNEDGVKGKVVLCDRGEIARVQKSKNVQDAGGVGMILANVEDGQSLNADPHHIPSVHVTRKDGDDIRKYAQSSTGAKLVRITKITVGDTPEAPLVARFSSQGPAIASKHNLIKPDIMAPGVDILAASTKQGFSILQGTSMASPHIAGIAAMIMQVNPTFRPAMIRSAMMTTATHLTNKGNPIPTAGDGEGLMSYGAGSVQPYRAVNPGLVYYSNVDDWYAYICATSRDDAVQDGKNCSAYDETHGYITENASNMNYPSIALGDMVYTQTIIRTVTNVSPFTNFYTSSIEGLNGLDVVVNPSTFTLNPGEETTYTVSVMNNGKQQSEVITGAIIWNRSENPEDNQSAIVVRSPVCVFPKVIAVPNEFNLMSTLSNSRLNSLGGFQKLHLRFGYNGFYRAVATNLEPANVQLGKVGLKERNFHVIRLEEPISLLRIALFDTLKCGEGADLDLHVWDQEFRKVGQSLNCNSNEQVDIRKANSGEANSSSIYYIIVHGYFTGDEGARYSLHYWPLSEPRNENDQHSLFQRGGGSRIRRNFVVGGPQRARGGEEDSLNLRWGGLEAEKKYLGLLNHYDSTQDPKATVDALGEPIATTIISF